MKSKGSRLLALLMAVLMMVSLLPVSAAAASDTAITLETDAGYTLNVTESYGLWATKDISRVAKWSYTFYLENAGSGRYPYRIYAEHNSTKYYICADGSDNVGLTTNAEDAKYFSASENNGKYTLLASPHGRYSKYIMIDASSSNNIKVKLQTSEGRVYRTVYGHAAAERHEISYIWSYPDSWSSWALTAAPSLVSIAEGQTYQVDSTYYKGMKRTISGETRVFSGWYLNKDWYDDLDGNCLEPGQTITMGTENIQLYGRWEKVTTHDVIYEWTCPDIDNFSTQLGRLPDGQRGLTAGEQHFVDPYYSAGKTAPYDNVTYVFSGWYVGDECVDGQRLTMDDEDIVIRGTWTKETSTTPTPTWPSEPEYTVHVITATPNDTAGNDYTKSYGEYDIKVRYEDEDGNLITFKDQVESFPITLDEDGEIEVNFENFVAPAGSNTDKYNGGEDSTAKYIEAFFYFDGHLDGLSHSQNIVIVDSFTLRDYEAFDSYFDYHIHDATGKDADKLKGTTEEYQATGVLHLVFTTPVTVTFDANDDEGPSATGMPDEQKVYKYEHATEPTDDPSRDGYDFDGWYTQPTGGTEFDFLQPITEDTTIYAHWTKTAAKVTFNTDGGTHTVGGVIYPTSAGKYYTETVDLGETVNAPADPSKNGYRFLGWYEAGVEEPFDFTTAINSDLTLYARYVKQITVTYDPQDGSVTIGGKTYTRSNPYTETVDAGPYYKPAGITVTPSSEYYEFSNWMTSDGQYSYNFNDGDVLTEDTTLTAYYIRYYFDLTYHPGKGDNGELAKLTVDGKVYDDNNTYTILQRLYRSIPNPTPELEDYDFLGWYTKENGEYSAQPFDFTKVPQTYEPTDLYGRWEKRHTITFDPTFDPSFGPVFGTIGGTMTVGTAEYPGANGELYTVKVSDGANYTIPNSGSTPAMTVTAPEGYEFAGWATKGDDGKLTLVDKLSNIKDDVTLYAKYDRIVFRITYFDNGGQYTANGVVYPNNIINSFSETVYYGDASAAAISNVNRLGYIFDGWFYTSGGTEYEFVPNVTKVYSDLDVEAKWTERTATLTYDTYTETPAGANGGYTTPLSETIGVVTGVPAGSEAAARAFYKFTGWYVGDTKVSDSAVLTKDVIDLYAKDADGLYKDTTFTAHFTERVYTIDITKTVSRSSSSEKPGRVSFTFELGALSGAMPWSAETQAAENTTMVYSTEIRTNGTGKYTGSITVYGHVLADLGAWRSYVLTENDDGLRYWRYDESVYQVSFDPNGDTVEIALEGRNGGTTVVSAAAFENRYSRVESDIDFGRVEVIKIDEDDEETYLEGAKFKLYETGTDRLVSALETGKDGKDTSTVAEGNYYLVESASPEGYTRDTDPIKVTVKADKTTTVYVTNKRTDTPKSLNDIDHYAYIVGYPDGTVRPQGSITRAEVATIFFRLLTDDVRNEYLTDNNNYSDVNPSDWYCTAVSTLSKMGIINGYTDGTFNPGGYITRAEFAAIAARFELNGNTTEADFSDIYTHWAKKEISIAANNGWILGYEDGSFRPNQLITRAEAMTLVNRVLNRVPEDKSDLLRGMTEWTDNMNTAVWYYLAVQEATNSHEFERKDNGYETWTELCANRDWTEFER